MSDEIKVAVVDDHPLFVRGIVDVLDRERGITVVGVGGSAVTALNLLREKQPNVLLLDFDLPGTSGLAFFRELRGNQRVPVVMLTMFREEAIVNEALNAGVKGYVLKQDPEDEIIRAIRAVHCGQIYLTPSLSNVVIRRMRCAEVLTSEINGLHALTPTEWRVLGCVACNQTSQAIAEELGMGIRTVHKHRENLCHKLNLRGPNKLLEFALKHRDGIQHAGAMAQAES